MTPSMRLYCWFDGICTMLIVNHAMSLHKYWFSIICSLWTLWRQTNEAIYIDELDDKKNNNSHSQCVQIVISETDKSHLDDVCRVAVAGVGWGFLREFQFLKYFLKIWWLFLELYTQTSIGLPIPRMLSC